jgi:hypothetical protein
MFQRARIWTAAAAAVWLIAAGAAFWGGKTTMGGVYLLISGIWAMNTVSGFKRS